MDFAAHVLHIFTSSNYPQMLKNPQSNNYIEFHTATFKKRRDITN